MVPKTLTTTGAVASMLMPVAEAGALVLPALSVQDPDADCPVPSPLSTVGGSHEATPESASVAP